jgi:HPt (histidine-containing phosphotransfer) domain-containing protein
MDGAQTVVDWEQLDMVAFGYTPDFVEIYSEFLDQTPALLDAIGKARLRGDVSAVAELSHKLKGSALNFGFCGVSAPMAQLERSTKDTKTLDGAEEKIAMATRNFAAARDEVAAARHI